MLLGTIPAATTGTISTTFLPQLIHFDRATVPTSLQIEVLGDGTISNLEANTIGSISRTLRVANLGNQYYIPLSNGMVKKNTDITIANPAGADLDVYGYSSGMGNMYIRSQTKLVFASSGEYFSNFMELLLPGFASTDVLTVTYRNGFNQKLTPEDLRFNNSFSEYVADDATDFRLPNYNGQIKSVSYIPSADRTIGIVKYEPLKNIIE